MFIKFDDLDMLDFFENEPISVGKEDEATIYILYKGQSQISLVQ